MPRLWLLYERFIVRIADSVYIMVDIQELTYESTTHVQDMSC